MAASRWFAEDGLRLRVSSSHVVKAVMRPIDDLEADLGQLHLPCLGEVGQQRVDRRLVGADGVRAEPARAGRWTVSQLRTRVKNSSAAMGRLRQDGLDAGVGQCAQVGVKVGGEVEVVPGVLGVGVPQVQAQIRDERFGVLPGAGTGVDDLDDVGVAQIVGPAAATLGRPRRLGRRRSTVRGTSR